MIVRASTKQELVLLIEDNPLTAKLVRLTLETAGYAVLVSADGESAIATLKKDAPNLILLDMRLPDTDGLSLIKHLRVLPNGESIPIIAFSGFTSMVEEAKIANSGFNDFLLKPVEPSVLLKCVGAHLNKVQVTAQNLANKSLALILDDDPLQLKFTVLQFNHAGFEVIDAKDGVEGLALAQQHHPDVIISDVLMPNMDGFQFCKAIRQISTLSDTPIILVSANYVEDIDSELAKKIGANAYIYRSMGMQKIIDTVLECMGNKQPLPAVLDNEKSKNIDKVIRDRMLQQLERQVSINLANRQRSYAQHTILGKISDIADALLQNRQNGLPIDEILSRCLDSAGLSQGVFYYQYANTQLSMQSQYGFIEQLEALHNYFGVKDVILDIIQKDKIIAIPCVEMDSSISDKILSVSESRSALLVPMQGQNASSGLLAIFSSEDMLVDKDWIAFGNNVAAQFSQATELSNAFSRLVDSEQRFRQLAENVREVFYLIVPKTNEILYLSPVYELVWGRPVETLISNPTSLIDTVVPEDKPQFQTMLKQLFTSGQFTQEFRINCADGQIKWIEMRGTPIFDDAGNVSRVAGTAEDISERKNAELQILYLNRLYALLSGINALTVRAQDNQELFSEACRIAVEIGQFDLTWIGLIDYSDNTVSPAAKSGEDKCLHSLDGAKFSILPDHLHCDTIISETISSNSPQWQNDVNDDLININTKTAFKMDGCRSVVCLPLVSDQNVIGIAMLFSKSLIHFDASEVKLLNSIARDISFALNFLNAKENIRFLAMHDSLTGLGNRVTLKQRVKSAIVDAKTKQYTFGLMLININRFRDINDTLGHKTGDELLNEISERLVSTVFRSDMVACLGGDEFAILVPHLTQEHDIQLVAEKVNEAFQHGFNIQGVPLNIEARIGIAMYPKDAQTEGTLWRYADVALSTARHLKKRVCFYDVKDDVYDSKNLALLGELRDAFEQDELILHWQPKIDLASQKTLGAEALIRWEHPTRGLLFPDSFIPFVEHTALIQPLTEWVVKRAIMQASEWQEQGYAIEVAINVSVRNLQEKGFDKFIIDSAAKYHVPIERIVIEVTESAVMENAEIAKASLQHLRSAGVKVAIDDFGTGQSSLTYLKDLPVTDMKIDKSFIMELEEPSNHAIVRSSIDLAHNLGFSVTAEGIENEQAMQQIELLGCDVAQGYFISKPMPSDQFIKWMTASKWADTQLSSSSAEADNPHPAVHEDKLFYIIYVSTAVNLMSEPELDALLKQSQTDNASKDITGLLLYKGGNFMQILEGEKSSVMEVYNKISKDSRHKNMTRVFQGNSKKRKFENWSMGFYNMDKTNDLPDYASFLESHLSLLVFKQDSQFAYKFMHLFSGLK